jgi:preprotein translocase subunit SecE
MARNRKRAKERRARRPQPVGRRTREELAGPPSPLEHATPDAEIAEAAELPPDHELELSAADEEEFEEEAEEAAEAYEQGTDGRENQGALAVELAASEPLAETRRRPGNRLLNFLQGSWAELQRVQWPDRRQVVQATGVVIGFVIVAGVFLGLADLVARHLINYILYGHS